MLPIDLVPELPLDNTTCKACLSYTMQYHLSPYSLCLFGFQEVSQYIHKIGISKVWLDDISTINRGSEKTK